jgi:hypothetical protein
MDTLTTEVEAGLAKTSGMADQVIPAMSKLFDKMSPAIATLSEKLGTTAEHLWIVLVKQSYNLAIGNAVIVIFACMAIFVAFHMAKVWQKKIVDDGWNKEGWGGVIAIRIIVGIIGLIVITANTMNMIQRLINPEYYALATVLNYIK